MSGEIQGEGRADGPDFRRTMNLLALAFLIASLLLLGAFHALPMETGEDPERGWAIWVEVWGILLNPEQLSGDISGAIAFVSFLTFVGLIACCPFLIGLLRRSRLLWWMATILSGIATIGFSALVLGDIAEGNNPDLRETWPGMVCLLASPVLNFIGLLFIRGERREWPAA